MRRWSVFLTWGAMLLRVLVNAGDCPLNGQEEHAWLIRVTPMLPIADAAGDGKPEGGSGGATGPAKGGESPAPPPAKVFKFHGSGLEQNLRYRYKRDDPPKSEAAPSAAPAAGGRAAPSVQLPAAAPDQPWGSTNPESRGGSLEPGVTTMHGALVTPKKVLTVLDITLDDWFFINMKKGYLSLVGYNAEKKCSQEQWGLDVTSPEFSASFSLNAGLFLIINTHKPFAVEGEPFLFGPQGYPPAEDIVTAYHALAKNPDGKVMMHLFKDNKAITGGATVDVEFKFIPWKTCGKMAAVTKALDKEGRGLDAQVAPEYFFCSEGIPGIMNETMGGETEKFGFDWYRGSPVIYTKENQTKLPIGHYVYRTGPTGDPRIYATYNPKLSKTLGGPGGVPGSLTIAPPDPSDGDVPPEEVPAVQPDGMETTPDKRLRAQTATPPKPATKGSYVTISENWVVLTCAFASVAHFV